MKWPSPATAFVIGEQADEPAEMDTTGHTRGLQVGRVEKTRTRRHRRTTIEIVDAAMTRESSRARKWRTHSHSDGNENSIPMEMRIGGNDGALLTMGHKQAAD